MIIRQRYLQIAVLLIATIRLFVIGVPFALHSDPNSPSGKDFIPIYGGARCLLHGCNPYDISAIQAQLLGSGMPVSSLPKWHDEPPVYPPATFLVFSPFVSIPYKTWNLIWVFANAMLISLAGWLAWFYASSDYSWVATLIAAATIITSRGTLLLGQPANATIALFVIAIVFFLHNRHLNWATAALFLSLAIKPQIAGLAALYLIWQRIHWKHVVFAMAAAILVLLAGIGILQTRPASKSWLQDWRSNIAGSRAPGQINDPRPEYEDSYHEVNLDAVTSVLFKEDKVFHAVSLALFAVLFGIWLSCVYVSAGAGRIDHNVNLAALSILTLFPVYHRAYDLEILLIVVIAVSSVFRKSVVLGIISLVPIFMLNTIIFHSAVQRLILSRMPEQLLLHKHPLLFLILLREKDLMLLLELAIFCYVLARSTGSWSRNEVTMPVYSTAV